MLNRFILKLHSFIPESEAVLNAYQNKVIAFQIQHFPSAYFCIQNNSLKQVEPQDADVCFSGSLAQFLHLFFNQHTIGAIHIVGDMDLAQALFHLYRKENIPVQALIEDYFPTPIAQPLYAGLSHLKHWIQSNWKVRMNDLHYFLQDESNFIVSHEEAQKFNNEVDLLKHRVDRFEAHLKRLEESS